MPTPTHGAPTPTAPIFEHHPDARLGIGEASPRLSWRVAGAADAIDPNYRQRAVQLEIAVTDPDGASRTSLVELDTADQVFVDWPLAPLASRQGVDARVRLSDGASWGEWGPAGSVEVGLLDRTDWAAIPVGPRPGSIAPGAPDRIDPRPDHLQSADIPRGLRGSLTPPLRAPGRIRRTFRLPARARRARLYLSGHGLVEAEINGRRVGDEVLAPGWTSYHHRLRYSTYDVADLLVEGENAIGVWLGDGWWRGRLGFGGGKRDVYGEDLSALVQLEIIDEDGNAHLIVSDASWTGGPGPILSSGLYEGEVFDARLHDPAWSTPAFDDSEWTPVRAEALPATALVAPLGPPVRRVEELRPREIVDKGEGRYILDFGQNHSGRLRVRADGPAGHRLRLRHAEVLQGGELCLEPLRTADAEDVLVLSGAPIEWEPRFTIHGYRYVEVAGWIGELRPDSVVSEVVHSDMERRGWFDCSNPLIARLHSNVVWSLRSNFVDIPTDCPQRDERLGWTGDLQVFAPTAAFLYDVSGVLGSWLEDLAAEQADLDWVPPYVPYVPLEPFSLLPKDPMAVWGDVAVLTPLDLARSTGDDAVLRRQFDSARRWLEHVRRSAGPGLVCHASEQFGDWLDPSAPPEDPAGGATDKYLVATAYFARACRAFAALCAAIGEDALAAEYAELADAVARAFARTWLDESGALRAPTQTALALALVFGLFPDAGAAREGGKSLARMVREAGGRIATGFVGTPLIAHALTLADHVDEAYLLVENTECPGWLYAVTHGATTTWERWDSLLPDGTVNSPTMTSFSHYAFGAIADWLHRVVAGISPTEPGYRRILFAPRPGGSVTSARAEVLTPYGPASIDWSLEGGVLEAEVLVPVGAEATIDLPGSEPVAVGHGRHVLRRPFPARGSIDRR
ncbi:glycoside hydrolase family 78 protein [Actinomyces culturomici]|uniref:glycoside hydrolase family 78 protein n=1 Tax=Actinomyces culturomici TaxID=1926276 RepID=UPI000E209B99|nr:glycoside hydrolase family 78 protein [Actinomyces culturomici]